MQRVGPGGGDSGVSFFLVMINSLCLCGLQRVIEIRRRRLRVLLAIAASRGREFCDGIFGRLPSQILKRFFSIDVLLKKKRPLKMSGRFLPQLYNTPKAPKIGLPRRAGSGAKC